MTNLYKLKRLTGILLIVLSLIGCERSIKPVEFPVSIELTGKPLKIKTYRPKQLIVEDSLLIIINGFTDKSDHLFQVYNVKSMSLLREFGNFGPGPMEFGIYGYAQCINPKKQINNRFFHIVYDSEKKRIYYIDFRNGLIKSSIKVPLQHTNSDKLVYYSDSLVVSRLGDAGGGRLRITVNNKTKDIGYIPKLPFKMRPEHYYPVYVTVGSLVNVKKSRIVGASLGLGQYDFFNLSTDYLFSTIIHRDKNFKEKASLDSHRFQLQFVRYSREIKEYNSFIYSLCTKIDLNISTDFSTFKSRIHVLDWDGSPIKEYVLDRDISAFAYDSINNCFYGKDANVEDYQIIKYDLD